MVELPSERMYLVLLRAVFFLSAVLWLLFALTLHEGEYEIQWLAPWVVLFSSVFVHQVVYAFAVPLLYDNLIDLVWLTGDAAAMMSFAIIMEFYFLNPEGTQVDNIRNILLGCSMILLPLLLFIRINLWRQARPLSLIRTSYTRPFNLREIGGVGILFGNSIWRANLMGETRKLVVARGIIACVLMGGVIAFLFVNTLAGPFQELYFIPTQNIRTADNVTPYTSLLNPAVWSVAIGVLELENGPGHGVHLATSVTVIPLWDDSSPMKPDCVNLGLGTQLYGIGSPETVIGATTFFCPSRPLPSDDFMTEFELKTYPQMLYSEFQPDLLVTVNFTSLGIASDSIIDIASNSVQVMVGMTNNTEDILQMTAPTILIPGVNLIGLMSMEIHQTFTNPGAATLGLFESTKSTLIAQVTHVYPDPQALVSPRITNAPDIATLRISVLRDVNQWKIIQDYKRNSFLSGFSKIGGLWTFLSGIFAVIFGSSLMRILFGTKPISLFGLAHGWERSTIGKAYRAEYPAMKEEMEVPPSQRGLLCLIQDHIIDLDLIDEPDNNHDWKQVAAEDVPVELNHVEIGPNLNAGMGA